MSITRLSIDPQVHIDYGLAYPVTYIFAVPASVSDLKVYKKYSRTGPWIQILERKAGDFFNGIEAVRFDYQSNRAYISIAFNDVSDDTYLKVTDISGNAVGISFQGISKYYDSRDAVVVATADDWDGYPANNEPFKKACDIFTERKIWFTPGIITRGARVFRRPVDWTEIQSKIDAGFIEVACHSAEHLGYTYPYRYTGSHVGFNGGRYILIDNKRKFSGSFFLYLCRSFKWIIGAVKTKKYPLFVLPYRHNLSGWRVANQTDGSSCTITSNTARSVVCCEGLSGGTNNVWDKGDRYIIERYDEEIDGSKKDIINNLNLPFKRGAQKYVYAWIEPYGYSDDDIRRKLGECKYLVDRGTFFDDGFSSWDKKNSLYHRSGFSIQLDNCNSLAIASDKFNSVVSAGGIYHIMLHPRLVDLSSDSLFSRHLDYIQGRSNLWYVGFGHLYLYHFISERVVVEEFST